MVSIISDIRFSLSLSFFFFMSLVQVSIDSHFEFSHMYLRLIIYLFSLYEVLINWHLSTLTGGHHWSTCKDNVLSRSALHLQE